MSGFNPEIFVWAREGAGLALGDAAHALGIKVASLEDVEAGASAPSRPLLLRMAKLYRRSLLTFYLPAAPPKGDRGQDFRTVVADRTVDAEASIDALVRDLRSRQSVVRSILEDDEDARAAGFVGCVDMSIGVEGVKKSIEQTIGFDRAEFRKQATPELAFALLRSKVERAGIFVLLIGSLGSHHSAIPVEAFRGFAIADPIAPFIVINDQDAKTAWSFTLLHELAHLWLGATGVSAGRAEQRIERFCNEVAAEMLVSKSEVDAVDISNLEVEAQLVAIAKIAREWNVSRAMVAYRMLRAGTLAEASWQAVDGKLREMWAAERQREKEAGKAKKGAPSYYVIRRHRLGHAMLDFASRSISAGTLSPVKAAQVLGVKPRSVFPLLGAAAN